jgi:hypothetical protein
MEAASRAWQISCRCGFTESVWEAGGIRWKAKGNKRRFRSCPKCGERSWHTVSRDASSSSRESV